MGSTCGHERCRKPDPIDTHACIRGSTIVNPIRWSEATARCCRGSSIPSTSSTAHSLSCRGRCAVTPSTWTTVRNSPIVKKSRAGRPVKLSCWHHHHHHNHHHPLLLFHLCRHCCPEKDRLGRKPGVSEKAPQRLSTTEDKHLGLKAKDLGQAKRLTDKKPHRRLWVRAKLGPNHP